MSSSFRLVDSHCHLDFADFDVDRNQVIKRSKEQGLVYIINIGSSLPGSQASVDLASQYDFIYASVGIHPHEADKINEETTKSIQALSNKPKVVAIGEIGLDYYKGVSRASNQKRLFRELIDLAKLKSLPVIIHCREAQKDLLMILKEKDINNGVVHCFSGDEQFLKLVLEFGLFVSFTCNITYKKAGALRDLLKATPLDRLLLETDAPFLPPEGFRGRRNEPLHVKHLAEAIATIKQIDIQEVARITTENAKRLFNLP